ncbi:RNase adapter RapZ [uncultured Duncaniella sp.]|uniref:RapZ C-terminal domain-containing protein n=2 Tax=uncultured Duncaniella sp. TaxID=2768039 RepID=UPI0026F401C9|nr:RNase adapter RapZ [uncultured Duncaniella sp.]
MDMKQLNELYRRYTGKDAAQVKLLTPAGSSRKYYRLSGGGGEVSLIGVAGTDCKENEAFIYLSRHFYEKGLPVPRVLAVSDDGMCYLESDLGDVSLFALKGDEGLLEKAVRMLARFHYEGSDGMDYTKCFPVDAFDRQSVMWDLNYFKYSFLNTSGISYSEPRLEADMVRLAEDVDRVTRNESRFMLRDFQSRNVMVKDGEVYFIDYQGGRRGPSAYDLASFLWQAKAGFSHELRERLIEVYADEARRYDDVDAEMLKQQVRSMALIRTLQVLGAYGLRGRFERKPHFLQSIPLALGNLRSLLDEGIGDYPYLNEMLPRLIEAGKGIGVGDDGFEGLTVRVSSFSFKKGIPEDPSGNGGGYVFDCRAMDNPGRYEEYRSLTGLDREVIEFLEAKGEIGRFLDSCHSLVDAAVGNYLNRGFNSLMVSYGCTGGQHRSVYSAQHTAEHIKERFPQVRVLLCHREQGIEETL